MTDQFASSIKLKTLEVLHMRKQRSTINERDKIRSRELTLNL